MEDDLFGERRTYQAPYIMNESAIPGGYIVSFHPGHTFEKHFATVGCRFEFPTLRDGYFGDLDDELLNAVRNDPGVRLVENDTAGPPPDDKNDW